MKLNGKNAMVTGGSRGIGRAVALTLAAAGANVIINYTSNEAAAMAVVNEIEALGVKGLALKADVSDGQAVKGMFDEIEASLDRVDILVNNAGITRDNLLIRMKEQDWEQVMDVNLKGAFLCTKAAVRKMIKQRFGKIINISSVVGVAGNPGQANYCASKAGLIGFTKSLAKELAGKGINVNAVAPGFIETDMTDQLSDQLREEMLKGIPMGRFGRPQDIADTVLFLSSDYANYITGQVIGVNGGMAL
ncbi:3-oxoacyl-[acyl-carrier-protein] reductase [Alkaliphilus crotonatoxidans]